VVVQLVADQLGEQPEELAEALWGDLPAELAVQRAEARLPDLLRSPHLLPLALLAPLVQPLRLLLRPLQQQLQPLQLPLRPFR